MVLLFCINEYWFVGWLYWGFNAILTAKVTSWCLVHTQLFLALYMCVFILNSFPLWLFLELDTLLWNIVLEVSGPFYNLIARNYATNFNMNFLEVSLLL